jgi:hypothetical protein
MKQILLIVLVIIIYKYAKGKNSNVPNVNEIDLTKYQFKNDASKLSENEKKKYIFISSFVYGLLLRNDAIQTPVDFNLVCAIVYQESVEQILKGYSNEMVLGYDGLSVGYFQVTKWAVAEFNQREKRNLTYADCYKEYENLLVGLSYLYYCYNSANKDIYLTGKKYNGGLDETLTSGNSMASSYAEKIVRRYNIFKSIIEI